MTATTALLRSLVRICGGTAAVVSADADGLVLAAHGDLARVDTGALIAAPIGAPRPDGWYVLAVLPLPRTEALPPATLRVLGLPPVPPPDALRAASIVAAEMWAELARALDAPVAVVAAGIDALNDAAAIVELPVAGAAPRFLHVNPAFTSLLGYDAAAMVGRTLEQLAGPLTDRNRLEFMIERVRAASAARIPIVCYRSDGVPIWVELSGRQFPGTAHGNPAIVMTLRDVSTRKEFEFALSKEKRKLQVTLAAIGDAVITTVADGRIDYVNVAARELLAVDAAHAYGEPLAAIVPLHDAAGHPTDILAVAVAPGGAVRGQAQFGRFPTIKHLAYVSSPIGDEGHVIVLRDVTAQQRLSTQLSYEASHDPLTGIYNRRKFEQLLDDAIASTTHDGGPHVLAYLDLDRFKVINDACGHGVGDRVLLDIAHLLQSQLRLGDALARLGGDEFAVLLYDCDAADALRILEKLRLAVEGYRLTDRSREFSVGVSIGMTPIDGSELLAGAIVARADAACYAAKSRGRNAIAAN